MYYYNQHIGMSMSNNSLVQFIKPFHLKENYVF